MVNKKIDRDMYSRIMIEKKLFPITYRKNLEKNKDKTKKETLEELKNIKLKFCI